MSLRNSQIIICKNIKLDREHKNVLNYTTNQMLTLVNSTGVYVASRNDFSFIRRNGTIAAEFPYSQAIICNYMAFQNPDFSNKWFFAWIDDIEYKSDSSIEISYTIDHWATWYDDFNYNPVFVNREHVNNDDYFVHYLPEPISASEFVRGVAKTRMFTDFSIIVIFYPGQLSLQDLPYGIDNKYFSLCQMYRFDCTQSGILELIDCLLGTGTYNLAAGTIINMICLPTDFLPSAQQTAGRISQTQSTTFDISYPEPTMLNGYTPQNKKCFTGQFFSYFMSNGQSKLTFAPEKFRNTGAIALFRIIMGMLPNGGAAIYPVGYNNVTGINRDYSLNLPNLPLVASQTDSYQAWLAYNAYGQAHGVLTDTVTSALQGGSSGGWAGALLEGGKSAVSGALRYFQTDMDAKASKDYVSGADSVSIDMLADQIGFITGEETAMYEDAKRIDNYFSQFGYRVDIVKVPNFTGRQYWNYIMCEGNCITGPMPQNVIEAVNAVLNSGVTIWHDHSYMLNYFVGGTDMQNPII